MHPLTPVDPTEATGRAKELLDLVHQRTGRVPNMVQLMANSPASLAAYLNFANALQDSALTPTMRSLISIAERMAGVSAESCSALAKFKYAASDAGEFAISWTMLGTRPVRWCTKSRSSFARPVASVGSTGVRVCIGRLLFQCC